MFQQIEVVQYRGIQNLIFHGLEQINLISGPNGSGKTSLAEAVWLFHGRYNPTLLWNAHLLRRVAPITPNPFNLLGGSHIELHGLEDNRRYGVTFQYEELLGLFTLGKAPNDGIKEPVPSEHEGNIRTGYSSIPIGRLHVTYEEPNRKTPSSKDFNVIPMPTGAVLDPPPARTSRPSAIIISGQAAPASAPQSDTIDRFSRLVAKGEKKNILEYLGIVQPSISDMEILAESGIPTLHAAIGQGSLLPIEALGGGITRLLVLFVNLYAAQNGVLVVDEIENGLHHKALPQLWLRVLNMARALNVQVFATTHSRECVEAAAEAARAGGIPEQLALHRLYGDVAHRKVERYSAEKLQGALELDLEVR